MTEQLHFHFSLSCIGEGNGSPLQCSCLENPRDGGAWWAAICGVTQSQTRLKRLSSSRSRGKHFSWAMPYLGSVSNWKTLLRLGWLCSALRLVRNTSLGRCFGRMDQTRALDFKRDTPHWNSRTTLQWACLLGYVSNFTSLNLRLFYQVGLIMTIWCVILMGVKRHKVRIVSDIVWHVGGAQ